MKKKKLHEKRGRRYIYNYLIFSGLILQDKTAVNIPFSRKKNIYEIITDRPVTIWARALPNHS